MGNLIVQMPKIPQSWKELFEAAQQIDDTYIPRIFTENPVLLLLFVLVFPHRLTNDVMKVVDVWADDLLRKSNNPPSISADLASQSSIE